MTTEACEDWFEELITHLAVAGGCGYWARLEPKAARGLNKCAVKHRGHANALMQVHMLEKGREGLDALPAQFLRHRGGDRRSDDARAERIRALRDEGRRGCDG